MECPPRQRMGCVTVPPCASRQVGLTSRALPSRHCGPASPEPRRRCWALTSPWAAPTTCANSVIMNGHIDATLPQLESAPSASPSGDEQAVLALLC